MRLFNFRNPQLLGFMLGTVGNFGKGKSLNFRTIEFGMVLGSVGK